MESRAGFFRGSLDFPYVFLWSSFCQIIESSLGFTGRWRSPSRCSSTTTAAWNMPRRWPCCRAASAFKVPGGSGFSVKKRRVPLCAVKKWICSGCLHVLPNIFRGFCNYEPLRPFVFPQAVQGRMTPWRPQPVTGDDSSESSRYGGHVMCVPGSKCQIAGVLGYRMGQENFMGRHGVIWPQMWGWNGPLGQKWKYMNIFNT